MFIEHLWQDSVVALLLAINGLCGAPERTLLLRPLTPADVVSIASALEQRSYRPEQWFGPGALGGALPLATAAPPILPGTAYGVVWLGVEPSGLEHISKSSGGLLYEDPFYALLAAYNLGEQTAAPVELRVSSRDQAWSQRQRIVEALRERRYRSESFFDLSGPRLPEAIPAPWRAGSVSGDDLLRMAQSGMTEVTVTGAPRRLYGLYHYVAP